MSILETNTIMVIGDTGVGKSENGNAYLQKHFFEANSDPDSVTFETIAKSNVIDDVQRYYIDTQGLESSENIDSKHIKQMISFLKAWDKGINAFFIVINVQSPRFDQGIQKLLKIVNDFFNDPNFWNQTGIIFTRCYKGNFNREISETKYRDKVVKFIKELPGCQNLDPQIPCFFVDSARWETDNDTKFEYTRIFAFAHKHSPVPTQNLKRVRPNYKSKEEIKKPRQLIKSEIVGSGPTAKKIMYYQDQIMFKYIGWDGKESYSSPTVERSYTEEIKPKVNEQIQNNVEVGSKIVGSDENAKKVITYENRKIIRYADLATGKVQEQVIVLNRFTKDVYTQVNEEIKKKVQVGTNTYGYGENEKQIDKYEDQKILRYIDMATGQSKEKKIVLSSYNEEKCAKVNEETKVEKSVQIIPIMKKVKGRRRYGICGPRKTTETLDYNLVKTKYVTYRRKNVIDTKGGFHPGNWEYVSERTEESRQ